MYSHTQGSGPTKIINAGGPPGINDKGKPSLCLRAWPCIISLTSSSIKDSLVPDSPNGGIKLLRTSPSSGRPGLSSRTGEPNLVHLLVQAFPSGGSDLETNRPHLPSHDQL